MSQELIYNFREQANYYSTKGKRFKILIETVTGCYGSCLGCAFTEDDRKKLNPLFPKEVLPKLFARLNYLLNYENNDSLVKEYDTTVINFGGSEHFVYSPDYLGELFDNTSLFFKNVKTKRNVLAFSSSGLLNVEKMNNKSVEMVKSLEKNQFVVDLVIDMNKFHLHKDRYQKSFDYFIENFGFVDLAINIESYSDQRDWSSFCEFVDQNGVLNVDLIYAINNNNLNRVPIQSSKIFDIYKNIVLNTKQGKGLFDISNHLRLKEDSFYDNLEKTEFIELVDSVSSKLLEDAIFIDNKFNVYPVLFLMFADIPLNDRLGFDPIGNIFDEDIANKFLSYKNSIKAKLLKSYSNSPHCTKCPIFKSCYQTGAPLINPLLDKAFKDKIYVACQNPVKDFILARDNSDFILKENEIG